MVFAWHVGGVLEMEIAEITMGLIEKYVFFHPVMSNICICFKYI